MASRLVITDLDGFDPNKDVTRAEFTTYVIKALGLYREDLNIISKFKDVSANDEHGLGIMLASDWGIVGGYPDGKFKPDANISRQEAIMMYYKAMEIVALKSINNGKISTFKDADKVSNWAKDSVTKVVSVGIFNGTGNGELSPLSKLSHAESITAIRNLLVKSKLINE